MKQMVKILVIDDDNKFLERVSEKLISDGHEVASGSGTDIYNILDNGFDFDLVLSDMIMPGIDGHEVLRKIRKLDKEIPVILMTGFGTIEDAVDSIKKGATDYISKPFRMEELGILVKRTLEVTHFKNQLNRFEDTLDRENVFGGLSSPLRRDILLGLKKTPMSFTELAKHCQIEDPTKLTFHLNKLKNGNLIVQKEKRKYILSQLGEKACDIILTI